MPDDKVLADINNGNIKVGKLVHEYLAAQALKIFPQAPFGDAITEYVERNDKHVMDTFVEDTLKTQFEEMLAQLNEKDEEEADLEELMDEIRAKQEEAHAAGQWKRPKKKGKLRLKPSGWDSDVVGAHWEDQPGAFDMDSVEVEDDSEVDDEDGASVVSAAKKKPAGKRAPAKKAPAKAKAPTKTKTKTAAKTPARGRKKFAEPSDDEDDDVVMLDSPPPKAQPKRAAAAKGRQTQLNFTQSQAKTSTARELSDDEISDDDEAFDPAPSTKRR